MTPEYLYQLANWVDPNELWRQGGLVRLIDMPEEQRRQVDAGVALRRYGAHLAKLQEAHAQQKSLLITPISQYGTAGGLVETPPNHQRLRDCRLKTLGSEPQPDLSDMDAGQAAAPSADAHSRGGPAPWLAWALHIIRERCPDVVESYQFAWAEQACSDAFKKGRLEATPRSNGD